MIGRGGAPPDDAELVRRGRQGDRDAIGQLLNRHQAVVYRFLLGLLADEDLAADVTQETLVRALRNLNGFRGDASFRTWLLAIARNEGRGALRRAGRRREAALDEVAPPMDSGATPEAQAMASAEVRRVRRVLDTLPEKQRLSVYLRLFDGLSFREIARATDSTEGSARVNYHHGLRRLRERLNDDEPH
jgi:RNA polymerase sigma-70 factor, ECF subfamily